MNGELDHREASELLGAYALDAVDSDERDTLEAHVAGCGWCQAEVMEHREVAALLTSSLAVPPPGLWPRISAAMEEQPPPLDLAAVVALKPTDARDLLAPGQARRSRRSRLWAGDDGRIAGMPARAVAAVVAVAAVAVFGVAGLVGTGVLDGGESTPQAAAPHGEELGRTIAAAMADPAATRVALRSGDGQVFAEAWMLPDGRGYLVSNNLEPLPPDRTYQLWALEGIDKISVGILGPAPDATAFRATGPVTALAITEEAGGGAPQPTSDPLVVGRLS